MITEHFSWNSQIHCVKQLHHLPELAALQSDLLRIFPLTSDHSSQTIAQVLQNIPAGLSNTRKITTAGLLFQHILEFPLLPFRIPAEDAGGKSGEIHQGVEQPESRGGKQR